MHDYIVFKSVPSSAPILKETVQGRLFKLKVVGRTKANNSYEACKRVAKVKGLPTHKLSSILFHTKSGNVMLEKYVGE